MTTKHFGGNFWVLKLGKFKGKRHSEDPSPESHQNPFGGSNLVKERSRAEEDNPSSSSSSLTKGVHYGLFVLFYACFLYL